MTETLAEKRCTPCRGGVSPLRVMKPNAGRYRLPIGSWLTMPIASSAVPIPQFPGIARFCSGSRRARRDRRPHPDISFGWGYATVSLSTKKIKGLHENDFIMASKIDRVLDRPGRPLDRQ